MAGLYAFIVGVITLGVGIGFYFQNQLKKTHQDAPGLSPFSQKQSVRP